MFSRALLLLAVIQSVSLRVSLGQSEGDLRLVGAQQRGRLDIFWKGKWGTICELSEEGADAACRQLGFKESSHVLRYSTAHEGIPKASDDMPIALGSTSCGYSELHILRCAYSTDTSACSHDQDIVIDCSPSYSFDDTYIYDSPYDTRVRLISNTFPSTGTLEIYINQQWGNVCYAQFGQGAADSACRQLGYTNANALISNETQTASRVWLPGVQCGSHTHKCFRCCFDEPNTPTTCPDSEYLTIHCTFDISKANEMSSGGENNCEYDNGCYDDNYDFVDNNIHHYVLYATVVPIAVVFGIVICICVAVTFVVCIMCCLKKKNCSCCCNRRRRPHYNIIHHPDDL